MSEVVIDGHVAGRRATALAERVMVISVKPGVARWRTPLHNLSAGTLVAKLAFQNDAPYWVTITLGLGSPGGSACLTLARLGCSNHLVPCQFSPSLGLLSEKVYAGAGGEARAFSA